MTAREGRPSVRSRVRSANTAIGAITLAALFAAGLWAQQGEADVGEASISTGLAFGGSGTNVAIDGAIATSLDRYLILMIEASYIPMGSSTLVGYPGITVHSSGLYEFSIPLQIRVPLRSKWEPYGIIAPVLIYNHYQRLKGYPNSAAYYFGASDVRGGAAVGGGVRYYWQYHWGFKGEYRYTITTRNVSLLLAGIFRQF